MPLKFKGDSPKNARIKIDYSGVKPRVNFSYPDKKHQTGGSMFFYILIIIMIVGVFVYSYYYSEKGIIYQIAIIFGFPYIAACLIYLPFKKYWSNIYPEFQASVASKKKYRKFLPKDIQKHKDYYVEIPLFKNVLLDYKATKDFSKYLGFFEIREHKFKYKRWVDIKRERRKKRPKWKSERFKKEQKKNRKTRELNDCLWYAKFYFSKKPKNGQLEVLFK